MPTHVSSDLSLDSESKEDQEDQEEQEEQEDQEDQEEQEEQEEPAHIAPESSSVISAEAADENRRIWIAQVAEKMGTVAKEMMEIQELLKKIAE